METNKILQKTITSSLTWQDPMLATLTYDYFSDSNWIYECKMDGERCLVYCNGKGAITLYSRNQQILNRIYPELVDALMSSNKKSFIIDGEVVAFGRDGVTSFSKLQNRIGLQKPTIEDITKTPVYYYVFDMLYLNGNDIKELPLIKRKSILKSNITFNKQIIYTKHYKKYGLKFYEIACKKKWEGLIAKNAFSFYQNRRSKDWLKFKCGNEQEFIIVGYTEPQGSRMQLGALLLGFYDKNTLKYAGKVGTGFDRTMLQRLKNLLTPLEIELPIIVKQVIKEKNIHWVEPKIVCEIGFSEWTQNNKLRHPRFLGLRYDKESGDVIKEE